MPSSSIVYADILLPLPLGATYTYKVPAALVKEATFGKRAEVQFGSKKRYAGLIINISSSAPDYRTKELISILDNEPVILPWQLQMWQWMATYYCCTPGEVMKAALPGALLLSSETIVSIMPVEEEEILQLNNPLYDIIRIIQSKSPITLLDLEKAIGLKVLYPHITQLYKLGMIIVLEELNETYTPKKIKLIQLSESYTSDHGLHEALDLVANNENQTNLLLSYLAEAGPSKKAVEPKIILEKAGVNKAALKPLIKKGILSEITQEVSRLDRYKSDVVETNISLTPSQKE